MIELNSISSRCAVMTNDGFGSGALVFEMWYMGARRVICDIPYFLLIYMITLIYCF